MRFEGKVALITGGGAGIGLTYARALGAEGASIVIADVDSDVGAAAAEELRADGTPAISVGCDVADEMAVEEAVGAAILGFGGVDILINNAAKHLTEYSVPPTVLPRDKWRRMLEVNVVGIVNCSAACRQTMRARGGGVIVNQLSTAGFSPTGPYGISKLAVRGLVFALATELAEDGTRVYGIAPGLVDSPAAMADLPPDLIDRLIAGQLIKRQGRMSDLVGALLFLCSDDAAFITGESLIIGGGQPLRV
jgi:NAD(P)-dependent dehydrogenase (short-subunit alcohol dehydrogenase family)